MGTRSPLAVLLATACQAAPSANSGFGSMPDITIAPASSTGSGSTGVSGGSGGTTSSGGGSASTSTGSESADGTTTTIFDLGSETDVGDGKPAGCKGKIDFLFVVSRDANMELVQAQLVDAFPTFVATIQAKFNDFDYHIMVVDGEPDWGLPYCTAECPKPFEKFCTLDDYPCDLLDLVTECDQTLGAGNVFAAGDDAYNKPCAIAGGQRFLTRDQPDLTESFTCIAQLGSSGRGWIGEALTAAVGPQLSWPGACNEGFLRDDALLMVTLVAANWDEEGKPFGSAGTAEKWAKAVIDAKKGDANAVVMLDIGDTNCPLPEDRLCEMTKMFKFHHIESILAPDYGDAFDQATDLVEDACEGFVAPG